MEPHPARKRPENSAERNLILAERRQMLKQLLMSSVVAGVLAFGVPTATMIAQQTTATEDAKKAGKETKKAGKEAGDATKDAAKATGKGVKHAAKKTAHGAEKAGKAVKDGATLDTTTAVCKDGTTQKGKTKTTACDGHGGVAAK
jgi:hypothetical protein